MIGSTPADVNGFGRTNFSLASTRSRLRTLQYLYTLIGSTVARQTVPTERGVRSMGLLTLGLRKAQYLVFLSTLNGKRTEQHAQCQEQETIVQQVCRGLSLCPHGWL